MTLCCGSAQAVASESGANFINVSMATLASKWFGEGEKYVRALFSLAHKIAPRQAAAPSPALPFAVCHPPPPPFSSISSSCFSPSFPSLLLPPSSSPSSLSPPPSSPPPPPLPSSPSPPPPDEKTSHAAVVLFNIPQLHVFPFTFQSCSSPVAPPSPSSCFCRWLVVQDSSETCCPLHIRMLTTVVAVVLPPLSSRAVHPWPAAWCLWTRWTACSGAATRQGSTRPCARSRTSSCPTGTASGQRRTTASSSW